MAIPSKNLGRCFDAGVAPDKIAIIDIRDWEHPVSLDYRTFDAECDAVARGLSASGLRRGARVGILSLNRHELLAAFFGIMRAGLVAVPISFKLSRDTVDYIVADAGLVAIFHDAERADLVPPGVRAIGFDDSGYAALRSPGPFATIEPGDREVAMMLYTSGSTGRPKGVLLSHQSQRWALEQALALFGDLSHHRFIVAAPMFHMNATFSVQQALAFGASLVLMPAFEAKSYAQGDRALRHHLADLGADHAGAGGA